MNWNIETISADNIQHTSTCIETTEQSVQAALNACADYAFSLFNENIDDSARYCLFIWEVEEQQLTIVVTDENKSQDGKHKVKMTFSAIPSGEGEDSADAIKYWLTDYLTTCPAFLSFSLLAGFVRGGRERVELM